MGWWSTDSLSYPSAVKASEIDSEQWQASAVRGVVEAFRGIGRASSLTKTLDAILDGLTIVLASDAAGIHVVRPSSRQPAIGRDRGYGTAEEAGRFEQNGLLEQVLAARGSFRLTGKDPELEERRGRPTTRSAMGTPIFGARGDLRGAIVLESDQADAFSGDSLSLLEAYAGGVAPAIERALLYSLTDEERRLDNELSVARRVLAGLLPRREIRIKGFDIAVLNKPCHEVGGDYHDFFSVGYGRWALAIADVVGKGVPAALLVAALRASLYSLASHDLALRALFRRTNRFFYESAGRDGKFVTLFYAIMDLRSRRLIYVNAGHLPPILMRTDGAVEYLEEGGVPLGLFPESRYFEEFARMNGGDVLAFYTDGVTEAMNDRDEEFGRDRLAESLRRTRGGSAAEIREEVLKDLRRFSDRRLADDQTLIVIKAT